MENLKYPTGRFKSKDTYTEDEIKGFKETLKGLPAELEKVVNGITKEQLATAYRPDGWTAQQVIHHISDSHMNMLTRLKWTLTEDSPTIKAYHEDRWAKLSDYTLPYQLSVDMLKIIHAKVIALVENLDDEGLDKHYFHPETGSAYKLKTVLALYAWHGNHHLAHLKICKGEWS